MRRVASASTRAASSTIRPRATFTRWAEGREYPDRNTARRELFAYIEGYYNRARIHSAIGYITPHQAEAEAA